MQRLTNTRIAPTPSGYLHLGNVLSFALTAALAKQSGARIVLRIDDLDGERVRRKYVDDIFDTLSFLDIPWHEGPKNYGEHVAMYSQVHRMDLYRDALQRLRDSGLIFACDCSRATLLRHHPDGVYTGTCRHRGLPLDHAGYSWRIDTSAAGLPPRMHDFVVRKKDGFPAYQLASLVDDMHFGIDLVVRGEDLLASTMAQIHLADVLGYRQFLGATFRHHVLLRSQADEKLSKSAGATSVHYLRKAGYTKADIYRMVGQLAGLPDSITCWEALVPSIPVLILPVLP